MPEAPHTPLTPGRALLYGAGVVGAIDFLYATGYFVLTGRPWHRVWQHVASAVLGRDAAFSGGVATVALGVFFHFMVAACIVAVYLLASRWLPILRTKTLLWGVAYGVAAFFVMNLVVIPLTRIGPQPLAWHAFNVGGLIVHALLLGPAAAYFAGRVGGRSSNARPG